MSHVWPLLYRLLPLVVGILGWVLAFNNRLWGAVIAVSGALLWSEGVRWFSPHPDPTFVECETLSWRVAGPETPTRRSWCRFTVLNKGGRAPIRVRLVAIRPDLQVNDLGGALEAVGLISNDGEVTVNRGERQKFDLFMMANRAVSHPRRANYGGVVRQGPRRLFQYWLLLVNNEGVEPTTVRYEFDVIAHAGPVSRQATFEVRLTKKGPQIAKMKG